MKRALQGSRKNRASAEDGDVTLDDSVKLFEEGIKLSGICSEYLKNAQQKVEILMENGTDTPDVKDFKANE